MSTLHGDAVVGGVEDGALLQRELSLDLDAKTYIQKADAIQVYLRFVQIAQDASNEGRGALEKKHMSQCLSFLEQQIQSECLELLNAAGKPLSALMSQSACLVNIKEEITMFLANLEVYGSLPLQEYQASADFKELVITDYTSQCRFQTITQLQALIRRLGNLQEQTLLHIRNPLVDPIARRQVPRLIEILERVLKVFLRKKELSVEQAQQEASVFQVGDDDEEAAHPGDEDQQSRTQSIRNDSDSDEEDKKEYAESGKVGNEGTASKALENAK